MKAKKKKKVKVKVKNKKNNRVDQKKMSTKVKRGGLGSSRSIKSINSRRRRDSKKFSKSKLAMNRINKQKKSQYAKIS